MFRTVPLSIIRSFSLYTQQRYMSYSLRAGSRWILLASSMTYTVAVCPVDGQRNCPKHVEFYSKNKFEKLVQLVGFIIRIPKYELQPNCGQCCLVRIEGCGQY